MKSALVKQAFDLYNENTAVGLHFGTDSYNAPGHNFQVRNSLATFEKKDTKTRHAWAFLSQRLSYYGIDTRKYLYWCKATGQHPTSSSMQAFKDYKGWCEKWGDEAAARASAYRELKAITFKPDGVRFRRMFKQPYAFNVENGMLTILDDLREEKLSMETVVVWSLAPQVFEYWYQIKIANFALDAAVQAVARHRSMLKYFWGLP